LSLGSYLADCVLALVLVASLGVTAWCGRRALAPQWSGGMARLAEVTLAVATAEVLAELLGSFGAFRRIPYVAGAAVLAVIVGASTRRARLRAAPASSPDGVRPSPPRSSVAELLVAGAAVAVVLVAWFAHALSVLSTGITDIDSNQYHLPFAATFVQTGWVSRLHFAWVDPTWTYYPFGGELLHAVGILLFRTDLLSVVLNLAWLAWALVAAWYVGVPWRVQALTTAAAAVVAATPVMEASAPGAATVDMAVIALLLTALAVIANGATTLGTDRRARIHFSTGELAIAGVAVGLAIGTKVNAAGAGVTIVVGLVVLAASGTRLRTLLACGLPAALSGGFWYVRNLIRESSPLPSVHLPGLPYQVFPVVQRQKPIFAVLGRGAFWRALPGGLIDGLGLLWAVTVVLAVAGIAWALLRPVSPFHRLAAAAAIVNLILYGFTPGSAGEPLFQYENLGANVRYAGISIVLGLGLLALQLRARSRLTKALGLAFVALVVGAQVPVARHVRGWPLNHRLAAAALVAALLVVIAAARIALVKAPRRTRAPAALLGLAVVLVAAVGGLREIRHYDRLRYVAPGAPGTTLITQWAAQVSGARIAVTGFAEQYPLFGSHDTNRVDYLSASKHRGQFAAIRTCDQYRQALAAGHYTYVVTGPDTWGTQTTPQEAWMRSDPAAAPVVAAYGATVFRLTAGPATPCPPGQPAVVDLVPGKTAPATFQAAGRPPRRAPS
jgi:hypothetical protein